MASHNQIGPNKDLATGPGILDVIDDHVKMTVMRLHDTPRCKAIRHYASFYEGSQHDHLARKWDGSYRDPGVGYLHERLKPQGFVPTQAIPYGLRKPDTHIPLGRQITNRFTEMLLGSGRQPTLYVPADAKTGRYLQAVFREALLWDVLTEARDCAGQCGAAAIVPAVVEGTPVAEVLSPADIHVLKWRDGAGWQPSIVVEQRLVDKLVPNDAGKLETKKYWRTRLWNETHAVAYDDVPERHEGVIPVAKDGEVEHHAGRCPVVWYQNTRSTKRPEGSPDCAGIWHLLDKHDRLASQTCRASQANADPTLHIKENERYTRRGLEFRKGSSGAVVTSPEGDAKYLEIAGSSIKVGMELMAALKEEILQTAECVIVDPSTAGAYKSGEAIQLLWRAMEAKCNRLRVTLEAAIKDLCRIWLSMGRKLKVANLEDEKPGEGILLPPVVKRPDQPEGVDEIEENDAEISVQEVGTGSHVEFRWPPYWNPTPKQINDLALAMTAAQAAGVLSKESRITVMANFLGLDPQAEQTRLQLEKLHDDKDDELAFDREMEREEKRLQAAKVQGGGEAEDDDKEGENSDQGGSGSESAESGESSPEA